ncbi:MAG: GNAT family N-acetyltransferase [Bacilli bacterium]|jgi:RimJ/RimL family protein N-acetyltransferase
MKKQFDTPQLILRGFEDLDLHAFYSMLDDNKKDGEVLDFNEVYKDFKAKEKSSNYYAIVLKKSMKVIGGLFVKKVNSTDYEIGYLINNSYKNIGYATEALRGAVEELKPDGAKNIVALESSKSVKPFKLLENEGFLSFNDLYKVMCFFKD